MSPSAAQALRQLVPAFLWHGLLRTPCVAAGDATLAALHEAGVLPGLAIEADSPGDPGIAGALERALELWENLKFHYMRRS